MDKVGRNELCPCNSDQKYKKCCLRLEQTRPERSTAAIASRSLTQKNTALVGGMFEIFGLHRPWMKVRDGMTNGQIREFYRYIAELWPVGAASLELLPPPDSSLRALYLGENEPELMVQNVFRFCLYADQIVLVNPFDNPNLVAEQFNPVVHPDEWKIQTLRLVYHLKMLAPWIEAGLVLLIPDPGDSDRNLRVRMWDLAQQRLKGWMPSDQDLEEAIMRQRTQRSFLMAPRNYLERIARETSPGLSDQEVQTLVNSMERERANDPLLPNETLDRMPGQMIVTRMGANLEMGLYLCRAIGAFPYTNVKTRWNEILSARNLDQTAEVWSPLTRAFQRLKFRFLDKVDSEFACSVRKDGRLESFRSFLRKMWRAVDGDRDAAKAETIARDFGDELTQAHKEAEAEWNAIDREVMKWAVPRLGGAALAGGVFSPAFAAGGFVLAGINEIIQAHLKRREFRKKTPMSVFIDLERR